MSAALLEALKAIPTPDLHEANADTKYWLRRAQDESLDEYTYRGEKVAFEESEWAAYSHSWADGMAGSEAVTRDLRVMFAAMARVQPQSGVAYFQQGELRDILGRDGKPCTQQAVTKAIAAAKANGYVLDKSDARRVWLDRQHVQRGGKTGTVPIPEFEGSF